MARGNSLIVGYLMGSRQFVFPVSKQLRSELCGSMRVGGYSSQYVIWEGEGRARRVVGHDMFFSTLPLRLVSLAALAQARNTLLSPTAHPIHPPLRWLCSLASVRQLHRLLVAGPAVSIRSTLDDGTQAPSSGPQGAPKRELSETKPQTRTRTHTHREAQ